MKSPGLCRGILAGRQVYYFADSQNVVMADTVLGRFFGLFSFTLNCIECWHPRLFVIILFYYNIFIVTAAITV